MDELFEVDKETLVGCHRVFKIVANIYRYWMFLCIYFIRDMIATMARQMQTKGVWFPSADVELHSMGNLISGQYWKENERKLRKSNVMGGYW
jgi:hypothetical protein